MQMISDKKVVTIKDEDDEELMVYDHEFAEMFHQEGEDMMTAIGDKWAPLLSFSSTFKAPDNPKELNQSLYIFQPCVPKFESASSTVKM